MPPAPPTETLTDAERAAVDVVAAIATAATGMGLHRWPLITSRLRIAAIRASTGPDVWTELAPHIRALCDWRDTDATRQQLHQALTVPGVLDELRARLDLAVLRHRVTKQETTR